MVAFVTSGGKFPESINLNVSVNRIGGAKGSWIGSYRECQNTALFFVLPLTNSLQAIGWGILLARTIINHAKEIRSVMSTLLICWPMRFIFDQLPVYLTCLRLVLS